jgi:hypothetical protein
MRSLPPVLAAAIVGALGFCLAVPATAQKQEPMAGAAPQRGTEERPFGGPPPNSRSLRPKKQGTTCRTAVGTCRLGKAETLGAACACPAGAGVPTPGKVE